MGAIMSCCTQDVKVPPSGIYRGQQCYGRDISPSSRRDAQSVRGKRTIPIKIVNPLQNDQSTLKYVSLVNPRKNRYYNDAFEASVEAESTTGRQKHVGERDICLEVEIGEAVYVYPSINEIHKQGGAPAVRPRRPPPKIVTPAWLQYSSDSNDSEQTARAMDALLPVAPSADIRREMQTNGKGREDLTIIDHSPWNTRATHDHDVDIPVPQEIDEQGPSPQSRRRFNRRASGRRLKRFFLSSKSDGTSGSTSESSLVARRRFLSRNSGVQKLGSILLPGRTAGGLRRRLKTGFRRPSVEAVQQVNSQPRRHLEPSHEPPVVITVASRQAIHSGPAISPTAGTPAVSAASPTSRSDVRLLMSKSPLSHYEFGAEAANSRRKSVQFEQPALANEKAVEEAANLPRRATVVAKPAVRKKLAAQNFDTLIKLKTREMDKLQRMTSVNPLGITHNPLVLKSTLANTDEDEIRAEENIDLTASPELATSRTLSQSFESGHETRRVFESVIQELKIAESFPGALTSSSNTVPSS